MSGPGLREQGCCSMEKVSYIIYQSAVDTAELKEVSGTSTVWIARAARSEVQREPKEPSDWRHLPRRSDGAPEGQA